MHDPLLYEGKRVVVTGCASGMGEAVATILVELGAEVIGLDVKPTNVAVKTYIQVDLKDKASIDAAVSEIGAGIDSIFSIAGLPGSPFSDLDTVLVNFVGARYLVESLLPVLNAGASIICTASNAGLGWQQDLEALMPAVATPGFDEGKAWCEANPEAIITGYYPSKKLLNAWVAWRGAQLMQQGIRLNCANPGPTDSAMMPALEVQNGKAMIDAFVGPSGRRASSAEQAWPMVFLNSPRCSYVAAEAIHIDGGFLGAMTTGQIDVNAILADLSSTAG